MMLVGRIFKASGAFWAAEAPMIGVFTQGTSRADAEAMLIDAVQEVVHREGFAVSVDRRDGDEVLVTANVPAALAAYVLKYQRETNGLSLADVAKKLGASSRNAYASYEQGRVEPSLSKYIELLAAVAPDMALIVGERKSAKAAMPRVKEGIHYEDVSHLGMGDRSPREKPTKPRTSSTKAPRTRKSAG